MRRVSKITEDDLVHMRALHQSARELSRNKNLSLSHREQCKGEAKCYGRVVALVEATLAAAHTAKDGTK